MKNQTRSRTYEQTVEDEFGNLVKVKRRRYDPNRAQKRKEGEAKTPPKRPAKEYAIFLMGRREYSQQELRQKMKGKGYEETTIEETLTWLSSQGFQSDERYAQIVVRNQRARYGDRRITQNLRQKGIDAELITESLNDSGDEEERAIQAISKFSKYDLKDPKTREKVVRFLASRGFSYDIIGKAWKHLTKRDIDDTEDF